MTTVAVESSGGGFEPVAAGAYAAICDQVVDLGLQPGGQYDPKHKVYIRFQVPAERVTWKNKDGQEQEGPMVIGRTFTLSLGEKSYLRPFLESWRGRAFTPDELRGFDIKNVLSVPAMIQVVHDTLKDGKVFAKVASAMSLPKGMPKPQAEGTFLYYDCDRPDSAVFEKLSKFIKGKIENRLTPEEVIHHMADTSDPNLPPVEAYEDDLDSIPF